MTSVSSEHLHQMTHIEALKGFTLKETKGGYNNQVSIWENFQGEKKVSRLLGQIPGSTQFEQSLTPFVSPQKLEKEDHILSILKKLGVPVPTVFFHSSSPLPVTVYEFIEGTTFAFPLDENLTVRNREQIAQIVGSFIGQLQAVQTPAVVQELISKVGGKQHYLFLHEKHTARCFQTVQFLLAVNIITENQAQKIMTLFETLLPMVTDRPFKLIHGDIYTGNILLDSEMKGLKGVIDWIDSSEIDDAWADILLASRWLAYGDNLEGIEQPSKKLLFETTVSSSNALTDQPIAIERAHKLLYFYDLLWHLRVLVTEHLRHRNTTVNQFIQTLNALLETFEKTN